MRISDWSSDVCSSDLGEEAILTARVVQVTVDAHGYAFARQSFGQWQALDEGPFEPVAWTEGTTPMLDGRQLQASFRFEPTGGSVQQRVLLARNGRQVDRKSTRLNSSH